MQATLKIGKKLYSKTLMIGLLFNFISSSNIYAWGDIGHSAVGYIAEENLTPQAKQMIYDLIGFEPLSFSGIFPDHVRSDKRFAGYKDGFSKYHILTIPEGQTFETLINRENRDADTIIKRVPELLFSAELDRAQKSLLLRYLVHVVGDVHQPLHIGNGLDLGGNLCHVNYFNPVSKKSESTTLHKLWDEELIEIIAFQFRNGSDKWFGFKELSNLILLESGIAKKIIKEGSRGQVYSDIEVIQVENSNQYEKANTAQNPAVWYNESRSLHLEVYPDNKFTKPEDRKYCSSLKEKTSVEAALTDETYVKNSLSLLKKQILKAGYRLAGMLNSLALKHNVKAIDPAKQKELLSATRIIHKPIV